MFTPYPYPHPEPLHSELMNEVVNLYLSENTLAELFPTAVVVTTNKTLLKMLALVQAFGQEAFVFLSKAKLYLAVAQYRYKIKGGAVPQLSAENREWLEFYISEAEDLRDTPEPEKPYNHWCYDLSKAIGAEYPKPPYRGKK